MPPQKAAAAAGTGKGGKKKKGKGDAAAPAAAPPRPSPAEEDPVTASHRRALVERAMALREQAGRELQAAADLRQGVVRFGGAAESTRFDSIH